MIITTGWGILVPIFGVGFPILMRLLVNTITGDSTFYQNNPILFYVALAIAAILCFQIGKRANTKFNQRNPANPNDGWGKKALRAAGRHTLFFIPMQYWAILIPLIGFVVKNQFGIY